MTKKIKTGRLTLPTELNFYDETKELLEKWGADAIRDSDGTDLDPDLLDLDATIYSKYFVARGDNDFAVQYLDETQRIFVMTDWHTAVNDTLEINIRAGFLEDQIVPDYEHDPKTWWQVHNRTTDELIDVSKWDIDPDTHIVTIQDTTPFHEYTVNVLVYMRWDPTQMYNHITNNWGDKAKEIPFDVRYPNSKQHMADTLRAWCEANPKVDVVRFTTFFYHFTLFFNDKGKEKFVDWFGYGSSVSPKALEAFEQEYGYRLVAEDFIQAGYYNTTYVPPTKEYLDYLNFQQRFVSQEAKVLVDIVHEYGKEAIMFLGDNWIGTEPYGKYFKDIGMDAVVGSVGGGQTMRLISDIPHVKYTEGRFLPYFFPDTFYEGNDPTIEGIDNWVTARRAIMRSPLSRIGYGGYPSLAYKFPKFVDMVTNIADEFRAIIGNIENKKPYARKTVAVMNAWGELRRWQAFMVAHALHYKQIYSYMGILESLSGLDVDVEFITFDEVKAGIPSHIDVIINAGDADTAFSGGVVWNDPEFVATIRKWVYEGHGFIGVGEPSAYEKGGRYFQLADILGVDKERGFTLSVDKYFTSVNEKDHFITKDLETEFNYGEQINNTYALNEDVEIIRMDNENVTLSAHQYGRGRGIYMMGLPYSHENTRILSRAIFYSQQDETSFDQFLSSNIHTELNVYKEANKVALLNNTSEIQVTTVFDGQGNAQALTLNPAEIKWGELNEETLEITF